MNRVTTSATRGAPRRLVRLSVLGSRPFKAERWVQFPYELLSFSVAFPGSGHPFAGVGTHCARGSVSLERSKNGMKGNGAPRALGARDSGFDSHLPD